MKNMFFGFMLFTCCVIMGQNKKTAFGLKVGLNYGDNGTIELSDLTSVKADDKIGYHLGVFVRGGLTDNIYLKPELQYTVANSNYNLNGEEKGYVVKKIDVPILLGVSVLGPIHFFGGPALQYIVKNDLEGVALNNVKNEFTVGVHFGVGVQFNHLNFDVRYERGLSKNRAESIDKDIRVDSRPDQFIIGLGIDL